MDTGRLWEPYCMDTGRIVVSMISFLSVQFKMVSMRSEKPICAPPTLGSFLNVAFETVPIFV